MDQMDDVDFIVRKTYKDNPQDVTDALKEASNARLNLHKSNALSDTGDRRLLGNVPGHIYHRMMQRFGRECWDDKKFVYAFFKAYSRFLIAPKL